MIEFPNEIKEELVTSIQNYFQDELSQEIGRFDAEFLLDFLLRKLGHMLTTRPCGTFTQSSHNKLIQWLNQFMNWKNRFLKGKNIILVL